MNWSSSQSSRGFLEWPKQNIILQGQLEGANKEKIAEIGMLEWIKSLCWNNIFEQYIADLWGGY